MRQILLCLLLFAILACNGPTLIEKRLKGTGLPSFNLISVDSMNINTANAKSGHSIVVFNLSTQCPYCRAQLKDMCNEMEKMRDVQFYLMSTSPLEQIKQIYQSNGLEKFSNVMMGVDTSNEFSRYFKTDRIPCTAIYGSDKKLKGVYLGTMRASQIRDVINSN